MVKKIKVNDQIIELSSSCRWEIRNGVLWNLNSERDEGVEGDVVDYESGGIRYRGHVVGYTCYQFISTQEWGSVVLSTTEPKPKFTHVSKVENADG